MHWGWAEHFCEVLNRPALTVPAQIEDVQDTLPINTEKFMEEKFRMAIKTLKNNRAPGMDGRSTEMKAGVETVVEWMSGL